MRYLILINFLAIALYADSISLEALKKAYNARIIANKVMFVGGKKININNGKTPSDKERINQGCKDRASVIAMLPSKTISYAALAPLDSPLNDASRCRNYELLGAVYGDNENEVRKNLVDTTFMGKMLKFNKLNGASKALEKVSIELERLSRKNPKLLDYLQDIGGTFKWRTIAGTNHLSAHSYGIAIDLNVARSSYWRWQREYENQIPQEIVYAFEKQGFIWGGRWHHFDTMHFEYRPEWFVK